MSQRLMAWLGKQAAQHFILPPKKRSVQTRTIKLQGGVVPTQPEEEETSAVQSPHRYGRKPPKPMEAAE